jgi:hypothetical protein
MADAGSRANIKVHQPGRDTRSLHKQTVNYEKGDRRPGQVQRQVLTCLRSRPRIQDWRLRQAIRHRPGFRPTLPITIFLRASHQSK